MVEGPTRLLQIDYLCPLSIKLLSIWLKNSNSMVFEKWKELEKNYLSIPNYNTC
jgi:hypothetical protein